MLRSLLAQVIAQNAIVDAASHINCGGTLASAIRSQSVTAIAAIQHVGGRHRLDPRPKCEHNGRRDQAIGGITSYRGGEKRTFYDPTLQEIARQHGKSAAQVMLRWHLQEGRSAIPKSTKPARIADNFDVFDFELSSDQIAAIDALDTGVRGGPDPDSITLEAYGREIPEA